MEQNLFKMLSMLIVNLSSPPTQNVISDSFCLSSHFWEPVCTVNNYLSLMPFGDYLVNTFEKIIPGILFHGI